MTAIVDASTARFDLITAGHRFLLRALPLRHPETEIALGGFSEDANRSQLPQPERDAILLRCLRVLDRHTGGRLPTLVDQYLAHGNEPRNCVARFCACIRRVLRYRGISDPRIQQAVAIVDARYGECSLTQQQVARAVDSSPTTFSVQFRRQIGLTFTEFIRDHRLDHAATQLATTNKTVKEVWAAVGYNHASNFDHDFRRRFNMSPREYRGRGIRPAQEPNAARGAVAVAEAPPRVAQKRHAVILVDDDEGTRDMIGTFLGMRGYRVSIASRGAEALQLAGDVRPDAMLLDYRLPDMDGLAVLRAIRSRRLLSPRVALFTADWDVYNSESEIAGLDAIIASKLCDLDEVETLVSYLVN